jgi:hypothetical protein
LSEQAGDPVVTLRREIDWFAGRLDLDAARIAGWTFVKSLGWEWDPLRLARSVPCSPPERRAISSRQAQPPYAAVQSRSGAP